MTSRTVLCISYRFPPEPYPLSIGLRGVIDHLRTEWTIEVVTAAEDAYAPPNVNIHHVPGSTSLHMMEELFRSARLEKFSDLLIWPDPYWSWLPAAVRRARQVVDSTSPDVILVFMMPYTTGFVGTRLKAKTGLPLVTSFNDSPTCSDMHPRFPSRLHYKLAQWMEDYFIQSSDRSVYVSWRNRNRVAARHAPADSNKLQLVRCTAEPVPSSNGSPPASSDSTFRIVYTGAMNGWYDLDPSPSSILKRLYQSWLHFGTYVHTRLDRRSHSPVFLGRAMRRVLDKHPEWSGRMQIDIYGNAHPESIIQRVLAAHDLNEIVNVHGRVPPEEVSTYTRNADLLFLTLPDRLDETQGGRISLKTYEYLMTDRPILAAVPPGENREYLKDKPGTYLTDPTDVDAMATVIETLARARFSGTGSRIPRPTLTSALSSKTRAQALSRILQDAIQQGVDNTQTSPRALPTYSSTDAAR